MMMVMGMLKGSLSRVLTQSDSDAYWVDLIATIQSFQSDQEYSYMNIYMRVNFVQLWLFQENSPFRCCVNSILTTSKNQIWFQFAGSTWKEGQEGSLYQETPRVRGISLRRALKRRVFWGSSSKRRTSQWTFCFWLHLLYFSSLLLYVPFVLFYVGHFSC